MRLSLGFALAAVPAAGHAVADDHPLKEAYFGETHVHTSWSFDAYIFGNHLTGPADSHKYAKGAVIEHPMGHDIKASAPLGLTAWATCALFVTTTLVAGQVISLRAPWTKIAVRVAGSWIAASGLLMVGWALR